MFYSNKKKYKEKLICEIVVNTSFAFYGDGDLSGLYTGLCHVFVMTLYSHIINSIQLKLVFVLFLIYKYFVFITT